MVEPGDLSPGGPWREEMAHQGPRNVELFGLECSDSCDSVVVDPSLFHNPPSCCQGHTPGKRRMFRGHKSRAFRGWKLKEEFLFCAMKKAGGKKLGAWV